MVSDEGDGEDVVQRGFVWNDRFNDLVYYNADKHDEYPGDGHLDVEVSRWGLGWGYLRKHITWVEGMSDGEWKG